jgi:hypothetical protein
MRFPLFFLLAFFVSGLVFAATDVDPTDYTLIAYELTADQEAGFDVNDGNPSEFWSAWDADDEGKLDYVHLIPSTHGSRGCSPDGCPPGGTLDPCSGPTGFEMGADDGQLFMRAAWGENGLYLYAIAVDDQFVDLVSQFNLEDRHDPVAYAGAEQWMNDCLDFALDIYDSETQRSHFTCRPSQETTSYRQYQLRFGGSDPVGILRVCDPDPARIATDCLAWMSAYYQVSISEAESKYGIVFEFHTLGDNKKAQEWLIPWDEIGCSGGINKPTAGVKIALAGGYNDMDESAIEQFVTVPDFLLLREGGNQYTQIEGAMAGGCKTGHNWGDIEFGGALDNLTGVVKHASSSRSANMLRTAGVSVERYTITGRRVQGYGRSSGAAALAVRTVSGPAQILVGNIAVR